jgi:hypothetical protein
MRRELATVLLVLGACTSATSVRESEALARCAAAQSCELRTPAGVALTVAEECQVAFLEARCNAVDRCLADCLRSGKFRRPNGGSGCYHQCANVLIKLGGRAVRCEWVAPPGFDECSDAATKSSSGGE